jgi:pimeloyl-ACP methyl ester carboxylesterase
MFTTHSFDTGELTLSYAEGPDAGPPLVLLHGATGRWQAHEPVVRALANQWHVYACDLRGHGESGRAPRAGAYLVRDYTRDITAFVRDGLPGDDQVALMGFSLGAMVVLGTAAALPDRVEGLVLVEPALMLRNHRFREMPIAGLLEAAYETVRTRPPFEQVVTACRALMPDAEDEIIVAVAIQLSKIDPEVTNPDVLDRGLEGSDLGAMLEAVTCPILVFHGEPALGSLVQPEDVDWVRHHARDVAVIPVAGAGHEIPMDVVVEHEQRFLQRRAPH